MAVAIVAVEVVVAISAFILCRTKARAASTKMRAALIADAAKDEQYADLLLREGR